MWDAQQLLPTRAEPADGRSRQDRRSAERIPNRGRESARRPRIGEDPDAARRARTPDRGTDDRCAAPHAQDARYAGAGPVSAAEAGTNRAICDGRAAEAAGPERNGVRTMEIQTTRFGRLTVDEDRVMTFPNGLLGFPDNGRFALIQAGEDNYFYWLQSVDEPSLAFVVTDPGIFFKDYNVPIREETVEALRLEDEAHAQVFVICNKVGDWLTGNLLGPIVANAANRLATQVVLTEKKWTTRQPLLKLQPEVPLAKSA
jgi:flagellar assembly factor FliW